MSTEWSAEELEIFALYDGKCIYFSDCRRPAVTLHEIIPKSHAPKTWMLPENRVPICAECHNHVHGHGAMNFVEQLRSLQRCLTT